MELFCAVSRLPCRDERVARYTGCQCTLPFGAFLTSLIIDRTVDGGGNVRVRVIPVRTDVTLWSFGSGEERKAQAFIKSRRFIFGLSAIVRGSLYFILKYYL
jgi:hypothetical protein